MARQGPGSRKNNPEFERTVGPNGGVGYRRVAGADRSRAESIKDTLPPQGSVYEEGDSEERAKEVAGELKRLFADAEFTLIDVNGDYINFAKAGDYVSEHEDEGYPLGVYARYPLFAPGKHGLAADANWGALTEGNGGRLPDHWRSRGNDIYVPVEDLLDEKNPKELQLLASISREATPPPPELPDKPYTPGIMSMTPNRVAAAQYGNYEQRQTLLSDPSWSVREALAQHGTDDQRQELIGDPDRRVREAVAEFGTDAQRQELIKDPNWRVRAAVAQHGSNDQRQELMGDKEQSVRNAVAKYGTDAQRQELMGDEEMGVRTTVAMYGTEAQRQELINDPSWYVRSAVARHGTEAQRQELMGDEDELVRDTAARYSTAD